jgi:hypothetical protein
MPAGTGVFAWCVEPEGRNVPRIHDLAALVVKFGRKLMDQALLMNKSSLTLLPCLISPSPQQAQHLVYKELVAA